MIKRRLQRLVRVYTSQNVKFLEISWRGSNVSEQSITFSIFIIEALQILHNSSLQVLHDNFHKKTDLYPNPWVKDV